MFDSSYNERCRKKKLNRLNPYKIKSALVMCSKFTFGFSTKTGLQKFNICDERRLY